MTLHVWGWLQNDVSLCVASFATVGVGCRMMWPASQLLIIGLSILHLVLAAG